MICLHCDKIINQPCLNCAALEAKLADSTAYCSGEWPCEASTAAASLERERNGLEAHLATMRAALEQAQRLLDISSLPHESWREGMEAIHAALASDAGSSTAFRSDCLPANQQEMPCTNCGTLLEERDGLREDVDGLTHTLDGLRRERDELWNAGFSVSADAERERQRADALQARLALAIPGTKITLDDYTTLQARVATLSAALEVYAAPAFWGYRDQERGGQSFYTSDAVMDGGAKAGAALDAEPKGTP